MKSISLREWRQFQLEDMTVGSVLRKLEQKNELNASDSDNQVFKVFVRERDKLTVRDGVLYRKVTIEGDEPRFQLVIPRSHRLIAMKGVHEDLFHTHLDDSLRQARLIRFFWPYMQKDLVKKIKRCEKCMRSKAQIQKAPKNSIITTSPMELLSIDFLTIEVKGKKQDILVILDHFNKFASAFCTKDRTALLEHCGQTSLWCTDFRREYSLTKVGILSPNF